MARNKEFNPDEALDRAVQAFWRHGYGGTTMQMLVDATGVVRASLYATFGNKAEIFALALERYGQMQAARLAGVPREQMLERWFEAAIEDAEREDVPGGCLLVTAAGDFAVLPAELQGLVQQHLERLRVFFRFCVQRPDEPPDSDELSALIDALHAANIGIYVLSRCRAPSQQLLRVARSALDMVERRD